jgi:GDSL/SGNH-like Acyl-Esterase family found in Pmr5 and Cas1p
VFESESHSIPQVQVLNRGAHYKGDDAYVAELRTALGVVEEWLDQCDLLAIKCHFFWRTTVPGHVNCRSFASPVNDKAKIEAHIANVSQYDETTLSYHWPNFRSQNLLAEAELLGRRPKLPYHILDGYDINVLRPGGHLRTDCLHSCYPGKMDVYNQLMLHYLRGDRTAEDVQRLQSVYYEQRWNVNVTAVYAPR